MNKKCFEMHIFEMYVTLIMFTMFTVCRANYLTKNIYLQVSFNILYVKNKNLYIRQINNNNIFILFKSMKLTTVSYITFYVFIIILKLHFNNSVPNLT